MFAVIETNGANKIVIAIPHEGSEKTLPTLAAMLEQNAVFINQGWREAKIVKPKMSIVLGDAYEAENDEQPVIVALPNVGAVIGEDFKIATAEAFTSNAAALAKLRTANEEQAAKLRVLENDLRDARAKIEALSKVGGEEEGEEE